ncbi:MAG: hypothetical protein U0528_11825 [Anaerolineae bacterium]|nr:hypothetical protein [Anaerolineae bacterium]
MRRSIVRLLIVGACLLFLLPSISASSARAFVEGIHIDAIESHHQSLRITLDAIKRVDGKWRQSEVHISYHYNYVDGSRDFDATVVLSGDPDQLEVSKDLGWGGLDTVIQVQWRRVDCTISPTRVCGAEIVETIPVEIHVSLWANESYIQDGGYFKRNAHLDPTSGVKGTIQTPDRLTQLQLGLSEVHASGYNFSDQFPG